MSEEFSLAGFAEYVLHDMSNNVELGREIALERAAQMVMAESRRVIGTYLFDWPQLSESTKRDRTHEGFAANEPLLRTGEMRDSVNYTITKPGAEAEVGSNSDVAVWQELGTSTIPARSFLGASAAYVERPVRRMIRDVVGAAAGAGSVNAEIAKIAIDVAADLAHDAHELLNSGEEPDRR